MDEKNMGEFEEWHSLFNDLCNRAGYFEDTALATAYCNLVGKKSEKQFDTVLRSLNNWRSGRHLPRSGNLRVLETLLGIRKDSTLYARWRALHRTTAPREIEPHALVSTITSRPVQGAVEFLLPAGLPVPLVSSSRIPRWSNLQAAIGG